MLELFSQAPKSAHNGAAGLGPEPLDRQAIRRFDGPLLS